MRSAAFRYISDAITKEEALAMLKAKEAGKKEREAKVVELGYIVSFIRVYCSTHHHNLFRYPAYVTSAGWLGMSSRLSLFYLGFISLPTGYTDEKIARLTKEAVAAGFNHFKMKVGADQANDLRRAKIIRSIIDDPQYLPAGTAPRDLNSEELRGKNAGPTGAVLMIDANQVWDVQQAIDYVSGLREIKPWYASPSSFLCYWFIYLMHKVYRGAYSARRYSWTCCDS